MGFFLNIVFLRFSNVVIKKAVIKNRSVSLLFYFIVYIMILKYFANSDETPVKIVCLELVFEWVFNIFLFRCR